MQMYGKFGGFPLNGIYIVWVGNIMTLDVSDCIIAYCHDIAAHWLLMAD